MLATAQQLDASEALDDPKNLLAPGDTLNDTYVVQELIGAGSMGQVYAAYDRLLARRVAIKVAWPAMGVSLRTEAQALAAVRHPSVVSVHAFGRHEGLEYMVMERIFGTTLDAHIGQRRASGQEFTIPEVLRLLASLADALAAVHRAGIAHRDVKPENVVLNRDERVMLMDLGIFLPEFAFEAQRTIAGTPEYMAPEAITNQVPDGAGHLVDLFALGAIGFELLAERLPFPGDGFVEVHARHRAGPAPRLLPLRPDAPAELASLIESLLARDPSDRPQSAEAVLWQLRSIEVHTEAHSPAEPLSVLIAGQDAETAVALRLLVAHTAADAEIRDAFTAEETLSLVRERPPHLLLLDLDLPDMNGAELCMCLRGESLADRCTIIAVADEARSQDRAFLEGLGVAGFVTKAEDLEAHIKPLVAKVRRRVGGDRATRPTAASQRPRAGTLFNGG